MPQYTLTLTRTTWGTPGPGPGHNPTPVEKRHARALVVAKRCNLKGWGGTRIEDGITRMADHSIWKVEGEDNDVCDLLAIWSRHRNMTYTADPPLQCGSIS
jgi:hypothetical protein